MAKINFYTLGENHLDQRDPRLALACRISEKAIGLGHQVFILTNSSADSQRLDDMLWQFKPASFLPHSVNSENLTEIISISDELPSSEYSDVVINLSDSTIKSAGRFSKINELVGPEEANLKTARSRYREYQAQGCEIQTHKIE